MADLTSLSPARSRPRPGILPVLVLLYSAYGLVLGFVQGGIGPILLSRGASVTQAGFVAVLFLPLGLAFLWSPFIERRRLPALPPATGWIIAMLGIAVTSATIIAFSPHFPLAVLLFLGLVVTAAMATMDIQFEALVVETVPDRLRPAAGAIKIGTFSMGAVLGGGVLIGFFERIGWTLTFLAIASYLSMALLAILLLSTNAAPGRTAKASLKKLFLNRAFRQKLAVSAFYLAACFLLFGLNRVALVDIGVALDRVGWLVGTVSPIVALPVVAIAGTAATRFGSRPVLAIFSCAGAGCGMLFCLAAANGMPQLAIAVTVAGASVLAGGYVVLLGMLLKWSAGNSPASNYATLYGFGNLVAMIPMVGAGALAANIGWAAYYIVATVVFMAASSILYRTIGSS